MKDTGIAERMIPGPGNALDWYSGLLHISNAATYWLATSDPQGRPHVMPVLAVLADGQMHFSTSLRSQKGRNLQTRTDCVLAAQSSEFDLSLDGYARQVVDQAALQRVADAYHHKYGWHVTVRNGAFHDAAGAPTAGVPPYSVFAIKPAKAFALGTDEQTMALSTRWQFTENREQDD